MGLWPVDLESHLSFMTGTGAAILLGIPEDVFGMFSPKVPKVAIIPKHVMANALKTPKGIDVCLMFAGSTVL